MSPALALAWLSILLPSDSPKKPSGTEIGAEVPIFYVREINGDRPNLAVCLVCKNGDRPSVIVCVRNLDEQVEMLLESLDRTLDAHRAAGLRGFAVFLGAQDQESKRLPAKLATLAYDRQLTMPLTIPVETASGPAALKLPEESTIVLLYSQKKIIARYLIKRGELENAKINAIIRSAKELADEHGR